MEGQQASWVVVAGEDHILRYVANLLAGLGVLGPDAEQLHGAGRGLQESQQDANGRRLAGSVGAEQTDGLAPGNVK